MASNRELRKISVFCGASTGTNPVFMAAAKRLGQHLIQQNIGLVYGGKAVTEHHFKLANFLVHTPAAQGESTEVSILLSEYHGNVRPLAHVYWQRDINTHTHTHNTQG